MLIIFTRYPTPGKVKTRLIPAVGARAAASLHRQMTDNTLYQARKLSQPIPVPVAVHFDGNNSQQIADWLGKDLIYEVQGDGDLGVRMNRSISLACQSADRVVLIGTDCPGLTTEILTQAFEMLLDRDLVLGAAVDGGYYLIGMCQPQPELFVGIDWSTDRVLHQTIDIANRLNLAIGYLPTLADIDRPEDLPLLAQAGLGAKISIVMPALNEAGSIAKVLANIQPLPNVEVILVDGGSIDDTVAIAAGLGVKVLSAAKGRAHQMNVGAKAATGEILLFLHADTVLPLNFETMVRSTFAPPLSGSKPAPVAGAFSLQIDNPLPSLRSIERLVAWRSRWRQMPYGDQAIFLTAATFWELGGFVELPIMEDFELIRRLQRLGQIEILAAPVVTSARRWLTWGVWQTTLINQAIVLGYLVGVPPARLASWYRRK
ncbi:TIGR04283 family arsenosugar biosynthesis glycosyltransferase [Chamaesiphon sp.]|uniref:TIGR04283 family arsenosugar biosynthesis glycosyltransferase n=1 Tax=Chamaesiphon sp. TaxID=2814140 RepID=UPI0035939B91